MGLQIRVRHALGERVVELNDRTAEDPVVVGRSASAQVQVPSVTVAARHCALFVHDGHWVVQDLGAGGGTYVNGEAVDSLALLQIGDVVTVGSAASAPTIEIDPAAAASGRTGYAGTGLPQSQPAYGGAGGYGVPGGYAPAGGYGTPMPAARGPAYAAPAYAAPAASHAGYEAAADEHTGDDIGQLASAATSSSYRRRRKKSGVGGQVAAVLIAAGVIGGATAFYVINKKDKTVTVVKTPEPEPEKKAVTKPTGGRVNMFEEATGGAPPLVKPPANGGSRLPPPDAAPVTPPAATPVKSPAATPVKPPAAVPATPPSTPAMPPPEEGMDARRPTPPPAKPAGSDVPPPPEEGMDMRKPPAPPASAPVVRDAENMDPVAANQWKSMQELADKPGKESFAVMRFEDFRRMNPGKYDAKLDEYVEKKLDRIWWERIDQLFRKMKKLDEDTKQARMALFDVNDPAEKKKLVDSVTSMAKEKETASKTLRETMGYTEDQPPSLDSDASLAEAAKKRSKQSYDNWKRITLKYIKDNQGKLLWMNDG